MLISSANIKLQTGRTATQINRHYQKEEVVIVCVLKGAFIFTADLVRHLKFPIEVDFIEVSSYKDDQESSGKVSLIKDISIDIQGRHVLIVEDIVDTGLTLKFLYDHLSASNPISLRACTLLDKPSRRKVWLNSYFRCFQIPDLFVWGYGMDNQGKDRNLSWIQDNSK